MNRYWKNCKEMEVLSKVFEPSIALPCLKRVCIQTVSIHRIVSLHIGIVTKMERILQGNIAIF